MPEGGIHRLPVRVYYEDTDFSGVVYHASFLRFMERGRTEFLRDAGIRQSELHGGPGGYFFVVRRMLIDWLKPGRMDDALVVETAIAAIKPASLVMAQAVTRDGVVLATAQVTVAGLRDGRPARLPDALRARLCAATGDDREIPPAVDPGSQRDGETQG